MPCHAIRQKSNNNIEFSPCKKRNYFPHPEQWSQETIECNKYSYSLKCNTNVYILKVEKENVMLNIVRNKDFRKYNLNIIVKCIIISKIQK